MESESEFSYNKDYLLDDEEIYNQKWACVSIVTPNIIKGCNKNLIKIRGCFESKDRAIDHSKKLFDSETNKLNVYVVEVGKWIAFNISEVNENIDLNDELNKLMIQYLIEMNISKKKHLERKDLLMSSKTQEEIESINNMDMEEYERIDKNKDLKNDSNFDKSKYKEIKYLEEDKIELISQKYVCISFLTSENMKDKSKINNNVIGFKIKKVLDKDEDTKEICKAFYKKDNIHNIYVGNIGHWLHFSNNAEVNEDKYDNEELDKIMNSLKDNQNKVEEFYKKNNENFTEKSNINEYESNLGNGPKEIHNLENKINEVDQELENAKKLYNELLLKENNIN